VDVRFTGPGREILEAAISRPRVVLRIAEVNDESDIFLLDPQMVQAGYWTWAHPQPSLPGIDTVPLAEEMGQVARKVGDAYGLVVETGPEAGTKVSMRIPKFRSDRVE
jgi:uncharacterized membrane protein